jgi:hypothetical protein
MKRGERGWAPDSSRECKKLLARIAEAPLFFAEAEDGICQVRVRRFPYCVYFRAKSDHIWVVSTHTARDPEMWKKR